MRRLMFQIFKNIHKLLQGKGIGKVKFIMKIHTKLFLYLRPNVVEFEGNILYFHRDKETPFKTLFLNGVYEEYESTIFKNTIKEGMVVVDLGANVGYYTILAASDFLPALKGGASFAAN